MWLEDDEENGSPSGLGEVRMRQMLLPRQMEQPVNKARSVAALMCLSTHIWEGERARVAEANSEIVAATANVFDGVDDVACSAACDN